jgi:4-amino-4-deoxy-L-arabinose transferase-like glycosyltransferase
LTSADPQPRRARLPILLCLLCLFGLAWFATLDYRDLIRPDEARYAEISREMAATGDWLTPRLNGFKYFEKPALQYWATAAAFTLFGINEWTARLWTALTGFCGVLLVYFTALRLYGRAAALPSAMVAISSFLYAFLGHFNTLDMGLAFFCTLALCAFLLAQYDGQNERGRRLCMLAAWAAAALAALSKGLVGALLPAGALFVYMAWQRDWRLLSRLHALPGVAIFLAITAPWFIAVSMENREFFRFFFIHEHFERFLTKAHGRYEPPWYFLPVLLAGMAPWTITLFPALAQGWKRDPRCVRSGRFQPNRFLLAWCGFILLFFSASSSKLPSYILPLVPALALLVGPYLVTAGRRALLWQGLPFAGVGLAIMALAPRATERAGPALPYDLLAGYVPWLQLTGLCMLAGALASAAFEWRGRRAAAVISLAAGGLAMAQVPLAGHQNLTSVYSAAGIIETVRPRLKPEAPFYSVNTFDHTLPYYLGRTVTMVAYRDELAAAIAWEPHKFLPDMAAFERAWTADKEAFAVFAPNDFAQLAPPLKATMQVLAEDPRRVIVTKAAAEAGAARP